MMMITNDDDGLALFNPMLMIIICLSESLYLSVCVYVENFFWILTAYTTNGQTCENDEIGINSNKQNRKKERKYHQPTHRHYKLRSIKRWCSSSFFSFYLFHSLSLDLKQC